MKTEALHAAFSLLPRRKADMAMRHVMERAREPLDLGAFEVHWAEFELNGQFVRAGISDISDLATVIVTNSQSDPGINLLARRAAAGDVTAGLVEWAGDHEQFLWYLPFRFFDENGRAGLRLRGMIVTSMLFGEIMELFNSDASLTRAEKRALFQLVGGLDLRRAARDDGVTYETKRAHTKAASDKLGCAGQKDLVRRTMGQMVHLMSVSESELKQAEPSVTLTETYLQDDMQLIIKRDRNGGKLRYLVGGPSGGRPVVMVHGMMFPVILRGISRFLDSSNIRLYVPIRTGYLEARGLGTLFDQRDIVEQCLREIASIADAEGLRSMPLVGNSLGAAVAVDLAVRHPGLFSGLILMSSNLAQPADSGMDRTGTFYQGMQDLKLNALLFRLVNLEYRKFYSDAETCRHILRTHFSENAVDLDVLDGHYCGHAAYRMFASTYPSSMVGIAEDFRHVMTTVPDAARELHMPLSIIHGENDPLTSFADIRRQYHAPKPGMDHVVAGAGHFAPASHGDEVWHAVAEACSLQ